MPEECYCVRVCSDGQYVAPLIKTANYHAETADTYLYAFSYSTQSESGSQTSEDVQVSTASGSLRLASLFIFHRF